MATKSVSSPSKISFNRDDFNSLLVKISQESYITGFTDTQEQYYDSMDEMVFNKVIPFLSYLRKAVEKGGKFA